MPAAERRRPALRPPARDATGRSVACAPRPRSWSCECRGRSRCGLDTTPDSPRHQAHHCGWSNVGRSLETRQAGALYLRYLITDEPAAHHVATQFSHGVGRDRLALGGAQAVKAFGGLLQLGTEAADAEPDQRCFHSVDDPTLLSDEALVLAVGPLGIFV